MISKKNKKINIEVLVKNYVKKFQIKHGNKTDKEFEEYINK